MILPEAFQGGVLPALLLAVAPPGHFFGVLAYEWTLYEGQPAWRLLLHVVRGQRRRGVGRQLIQSLMVRAAQRGVSFLVTQDAGDDVAVRGFLEALGFETCACTTAYEADLERYRAMTAPLGERLRRHGKVPAAARVVSVEEALREPLFAFLGEHFHLAPAAVANSRWPGWRRPSARQASAVLLLGDQVIGAVLADCKDARAEITWRVVAPEHRGGWANALLSAASWEQLIRCGARRVRFSTTSLTPDTERIVRIYGAEQVQRTNHFVLYLPSPRR